MKEDLQSRLKSVILSIGDIVVDCVNNDIGILVRRVRQFDIMLEELYIWEVRWINKAKEDLPMQGAIEEESLKLSIAVGTYEWHSINGESIEL
jgi:hypothetical protein|tara:strand:+ start:389 stop:667 length:279 start_codon:yes stop_codon:yes gene_type:complete